MKVWVLLVCPAVLGADTFFLKSGPPVSGTYAGGTARSIRLLVGERLKTFPIDEVVRIVFDNGLPRRATSADADRWRKAGDDASVGTIYKDGADKRRKIL